MSTCNNRPCNYLISLSNYLLNINMEVRKARKNHLKLFDYFFKGLWLWGSRWVIVGKIRSKCFPKILYVTFVQLFSSLPEPDLFVRTSGEQRTSGFLPWQLEYAEYKFIKKHWPDFTEKDIDDIIKEFQVRQRRFGGK